MFLSVVTRAASSYLARTRAPPPAISVTAGRAQRPVIVACHLQLSKSCITAWVAELCALDGAGRLPHIGQEISVQVVEPMLCRTLRTSM
jgi:hypothetical protein